MMISSDVRSSYALRRTADTPQPVGKTEVVIFPSDSLAARISMQNRNRGGFVVATTFDNDTPHKGSMKIGASPEWVTDHNHR